MLFICLQGFLDRETKKLTDNLNNELGRLTVAKGAPATEMEQKVAGSKDEVCADILNLAPRMSQEAQDFLNVLATLSCCMLLEDAAHNVSMLLGDAEEHLYQVENVYVQKPSRDANIRTQDGRLWALLQAWGWAKCVSFGFRRHALL